MKPWKQAKKGPGFDPFEDHEMLELTGEIAMEANDLEALEAVYRDAERAAARSVSGRLRGRPPGHDQNHPAAPRRR